MLLGLVSGCSGITTVAYDEKAPEASVRMFLVDLQNGRTSEAYGLLLPSRQQEVSRERFAHDVAFLGTGAGRITGLRVLGSSLLRPRPLTVQVRVTIQHEQTGTRTTGVEAVEVDGRWRVDLGDPAS